MFFSKNRRCPAEIAPTSSGVPSPAGCIVSAPICCSASHRASSRDVARPCQAYASLLKREITEDALVAEMVGMGYKEDEFKDAITLEMFITLFENHKADPKPRESIDYQTFSHGMDVPAGHALRGSRVVVNTDADTNTRCAH